MSVEHNDVGNEKEMAEFERKLRIAMQHRAAPVGMKQRVLARARDRRQTQHGRAWMWRRIAASAVLAAVFAGFAVYRQTEERALEQKKGEAAREQVLTAFRITQKTLDRVNERLDDDSDSRVKFQIYNR
jgi:anti-sigma-K factor RskA